MSEQPVHASQFRLGAEPERLPPKFVTEVAQRHLDELSNKQGLVGDARYVVLQDKVIDRGSYWSVAYQSEAFVRTADPKSMLAGNWPLKVLKDSDTVTGNELPVWMLPIAEGS